MSVKKVSMAVFIIGALTAIFSGVFPVNQDIKLVLLLVFGFLVGLLNISDHEQKDFMVASLAFLFSGWLLTNFVIPKNYYLLGSIIDIVSNLMIFVIPGVLTISLKMVFAYLSETDKKLLMEFPSPEDRHILVNIWDLIVLVSVAFVFVILILQMPVFQIEEAIPGIYAALDSLDWIIWGIFVIDLVVVFKQSNGIKDFMFRNWVDILAVVPFQLLGVFKIVRGVRIIRIFSKTSKISKINRGAKFFSESSGFNKLVNNEKKKSSKTKKSGSKSKSVSKKKSKK